MLWHYYTNLSRNFLKTIATYWQYSGIILQIVNHYAIPFNNINKTHLNLSRNTKLHHLLEQCELTPQVRYQNIWELNQ